MELIPTRLPDVMLLRPRTFADARGFFLETWNQRKFEEAGMAQQFVQDNHSHSSQWTLRGMHYQIQQTQGKLIRVSRGAIFDVAVDARKSSSTFGQWVGVELNDSNHEMLWVPPGFAHGFLALTDAVDVLYKCTDVYAPQYERTMRWDDPDVCIRWPIPSGVTPLLTQRDANALKLREIETFL